MFRNKNTEIYLQVMLVCRAYQNIGFMNVLSCVGNKIKTWFDTYIVVKI